MAINPYYSSNFYYTNEVNIDRQYPELDSVYYQTAPQPAEPLHANRVILLKVEYSARDSAGESQSLNEGSLYPELDRVYCQRAPQPAIPLPLPQPAAQPQEVDNDVMKINYNYRDTEEALLDSEVDRNIDTVLLCDDTVAELILHPPDFTWDPSETTGCESVQAEKISGDTEEQMVDDDYQSEQKEESDSVSQASDEAEVFFCHVCGTQTTPLWKTGPNKGLPRWREGANGSRLCETDYSNYRKMLSTNPGRAEVQYQTQLHSLEEARREHQKRQAQKLAELNFRTNPFCQFCGTTESEKFCDTKVVGFLCYSHYQKYGRIKREDAERAKKAFAPKYFTREEALADNEAYALREEEARQKIADLVFRKNPFCQYCGTTDKNLRYLNTGVVGYLCYSHYQSYGELNRKDPQLAAERYAPQYHTLAETEEAASEGYSSHDESM